MNEHDLEILGQKFSYPKSWHGTAVLISLFTCISFVFWSLEPNQINAYGEAVDKIREKKYMKIVDEVTKENLELKKLLKEVSSSDKLSNQEQQKVLQGVKNAQVGVSSAISLLEQIQENRKQEVKNISKEHLGEFNQKLLEEKVILNRLKEAQEEYK